MTRFIGYFYEYDSNGECIDDFKEWCYADTEEEAEDVLNDEYSHNERVKLKHVERMKD